MKAYVKPMLCFESYELNRTIAACTWDLQMENKDVCQAYQDNNPELDSHTSGHHDLSFPLFVTEDVCRTTEDQLKTSEGYCYTNGANLSNRVFQS